MIRRLAAVLAAAILLTTLTAPPASAHVHVSSNDAAQGGYGLLTFRVPTESDTASTTELIIELPKDTPITSVSTQPIPGWTAELKTEKLSEPIPSDHGEITSYVSQISWSADSKQDGIAPGEFQQFSISAGPLPETDSIAFPTEQRYSDGSSVSWDEIASGAAEPEHPAPALNLLPAEDPPDPSAEAASGPSPEADTAPNAPVVLDALTLALAAAALIVAVIAILRSRRN